MRTVCLVVVGALIAALSSLPVRAEKKADVPDGNWIKKEGDVKMEFADKGVLRIFPHGEKEAFVVVCSYSVAKDGAIKAKVKEYEGKEETKARAKNVVPIGLEFQFAWKVKDGVATLEEVKGDDVGAIKSHLEGQYELKK